MAPLKVFLEVEVHEAKTQLPGNIRQRIKRAIEELAVFPDPPGSRSLDTGTLGLGPEIEIRRLRIGRWRLIYAVNGEEGWVWVLGIRQRPPYNYEDLRDLANRLR